MTRDQNAENAAYAPQIRALMDAKNLKIKDLAAATGLGESGLGRIVSGRTKKPHPTSLSRIAAALGVEVEELREPLMPRREVCVHLPPDHYEVLLIDAALSGTSLEAKLASTVTSHLESIAEDPDVEAVLTVIAAGRAKRSGRTGKG